LDPNKRHPVLREYVRDRVAVRMTPASMLAMPRTVPAKFPASARASGDRRSVRFFRPAAACGEDNQPPASLRAIQAKRKLAAARPPRAAATSAAECAVGALVKAVHGAAAGGAAGAARGAGDAVAWVFSKVQFHSPDLTIGLLGMLASVVATAVEAEAERARVTAQAKDSDAPSDKSGEEEPETDDFDDDDGYPKVVADEDLPQLYEPDMQKEMWATIGIMHGSDDLHEDNNHMFEGLNDEEIHKINSARARRRRAGYERVIAAGGANALILSNYAQLLYELDKDMKRCFFPIYCVMNTTLFLPFTFAHVPPVVGTLISCA
jgi:hypothetical protein